MQTLIESLGSLSRIPQWFVWRMVWDAEEGKFLKHPCKEIAQPFPMDASLPHNWMTYQEAQEKVNSWNDHPFSISPNERYTVGFYLTADCGYWFLDMDKALVNGEWSTLAKEWMALCPGCFFEVSSSGNGGHIIGRGTVPDHAKRNKEIAAELYTEKRGIAFGTSGQAWGNADMGSAAIASIASLHFPPRPESEAGEFSQPRAEWSGPTDDDELIAKALASPSVAAKMGNKASFADLWNADPDALLRFYGPDGRTETDMALAQHLAFWTGCDAPRIERLMRRSKLARPKWDMHRTYLRELTITNACAQQVDVCKDKRAEKRAAMYAMQPASASLPPLPALAPLPVAPGVLTVLPVVTPEVKKLIDDLLSAVTSATDWDDVHNRVIPMVRAAGVPAALMPRLENAINKRLDLWDSKLPVAKLRSLLATPRAAGAAEDDDTVRPTWIDNYVYVRQNDKYFDIVNGYDISVASFKATHDRDMPVKGDGVLREDSHVWALHKWNVPLVHDTMYDPRAEALIDYDGRRWANLYSASSLPAAMPYTDAGVAAIERFKSHLWLLCGQRERIYENLLSFMAHCVQKPGKLIRWVPIIKGTEGDGKSMITEVMKAAMGRRNVSSFGPEIICNSGGFTDWAHGYAFIALEEMYMTGRERFMIANRLKLFITNNDVNIYPKGAKPKDVVNTCCKIAYTNHTDGIPLDERKDRRWFVVFTPFDTREQMWEAMGCTTEPQVRAHFDAVFDSLRREPGQWRAWLQSLTIPDWFSADGAALMTDEKKIMAQSGVDDIESILRNIVEEGAHGVSATILSSAMLTSALKARTFMEGMELPKTTNLHHMLNRIGFMKVTRLVKWQNMPHRLWIKPGVNEDNDNLRSLLDATTVTGRPGQAS